MVHKAYIIIWGCVLSLTFIFSVSATLSEAEKVFYKEHKDIFVQKKFWDEPTEKLFAPSQIICDATVFSAAAALGAWISPRFGLTDEFYNVRQCVTAALVGSFFLWLFIKWSTTSINKNTLKSFFQNYDSNSKSSDNGNFKLYIPQNLVTTFDALFKEYQINSDKLSNKCNELVQAIQQDIVKNNPTLHSDTTKTVLLTALCLAVVTLIATNIVILNKVDQGLHSVRDASDYWGKRFLYEIREPSVRQRI